MKIQGQLFWIALIVISLLTINSCCTKKYCIGADDLEEIWFYDFEKSAIDTIVIKRYNSGTNFNNFIDSSVTVPDYFSNRTDYQIIYLTDKLTTDYDYKVEIMSTGQIFTITGFIVKKKRCNTGFLCFDYFNSLESYKVNGEEQEYGFLRINNQMTKSL